MNIFKDEYGDLHWPWVAVLFIIFVSILFMVIFLPFIPLLMVSCKDISIQTGLVTKWTFWQGCYINWNGQWLTEEMFKAIAILK